MSGIQRSVRGHHEAHLSVFFFTSFICTNTKGCFACRSWDRKPAVGGRAAVWFDPLIYRHATSESSSLQFEVCGQQQKKEGEIKEAGRNNKQNKRNVNTLLSVPSCVDNDYVHMCLSGEKRNHHQLFDFFFLCRQLVWLLSPDCYATLTHKTLQKTGKLHEWLMCQRLAHPPTERLDTETGSEAHLWIPSKKACFSKEIWMDVRFWKSWFLNLRLLIEDFALTVLTLIACYVNVWREHAKQLETVFFKLPKIKNHLLSQTGPSNVKRMNPVWWHKGCSADHTESKVHEAWTSSIPLRSSNEHHMQPWEQSGTLCPLVAEIWEGLWWGRAANRAVFSCDVQPQEGEKSDRRPNSSMHLWNNPPRSQNRDTLNTLLWKCSEKLKSRTKHELNKQQWESQNHLLL